jgi:hypothetical protein
MLVNDRSQYILRSDFSVRVSHLSREPRQNRVVIRRDRYEFADDSVHSCRGEGAATTRNPVYAVLAEEGARVVVYSIWRASMKLICSLTALMSLSCLSA